MFMEALILRMKPHADKLRLIRLNQPYVSPEKAREQVLRVARCSAERG